MTEGRTTMSLTSSSKETAQSGRPTAERSDEQRRVARLNRTTLLLVAGAIVAIGVYLLVYVLQVRAWQLLVESGIVVVALMSAGVAYGLARRGKLDAAGYWVLFSVVVAYGGGELLLANATLYFAVGGVLLIILTGSMVLPHKWNVWLLTAGLFGAYSWLVNRFEPLPRYDITQSTLLNTVTGGVTLLVGLALCWYIIHTLRIGTIRTRLIAAFVTMALLLAVAIGAVSTAVGFRSGRDQVIAQLKSVAALKEAEIETWVHTLQTNMVIALSGSNVIPHTHTLLQAEPPDSDDYQEAHDKLSTRFQQIVEQTGQFEELFLMDLRGQVILSTDATQEGKIYANDTFFQRGLERPYIHPPLYSPSLEQASVITVLPVTDQQGEVMAVLAGRASMDALSKIMIERVGLGETGETYLVGANHAMLTASRFGEFGGEKKIYVRTEGANAAIADHTNDSGLYEGYRNEPVVGVFHWLPELQVAMLAEQDQAEALRPIYSMMSINVGVMLAAILLAVAASLFIVRSIVTPLADLSGTAMQIAAGDLERVAKVERADEIGALAHAFNSMTAQLRGLIGGLEQRVADRTRELERRSAYLEASAEVGRATTSILDPDQLTQQAVELIRERFGLYYVGLFQVDRRFEWAILRAGTGEAGRAMLERGHRIRIGEGMIGWSIVNAQARIASTAETDAVRLAMSELPNTRSEAALPLRSRGKVIGALTVQSDQPAAFDEDTIVVLQTMADQVAAAMDNARLFAVSQEALDAERQAYGDLSREAWAQMVRARPSLGYLCTPQGVYSTEGQWQPAMVQASQAGQTVQDGGHTVVIPLKIRDRVTGVVRLRKPDDAGEWTPEQITLLETLTDQLGVALESARLYQDTQRRATRERMTREITDKMRRATSVEDIVQTAVDELFSTLGTSRTFVRLGTTPSAQETND